MNTTSMTSAEIFGRIFQPENRILSKAAARSILRLDFDESDRAYMNTLAEKARDGILTEDENQHLETFIQVGNFLAIMQSKARRKLNTDLKANRGQ